MNQEAAPAGWRTVDIVVVAVIAVAFGAVFQAWNVVWEAVGPAFAAFPPLQGLIYGVWMLPAVIAPLVVRKPGAALFAELVAASASALFGTPWGLLTIVYGLIEGGAAELIFAMTGYRRWNVGVAIIAGAAAGIGGALLDLVTYYPSWAASWQVTYAVLVTASSAVVAGLGGWLLTRALADTGVLAPFPSGRSQRTV